MRIPFLEQRAIRPPDDVVPNENDPASVPPSTVGPDQLVTPGDPHGVAFAGDDPPLVSSRIIPSPWSGWPADWWPPYWGSGGSSMASLTDTAWGAIDLNASVLSTMPPYLVNAAPTLNADWLNNPNPDVYTSWEEFAKQLFWDYQAAGEAFVLATAHYSTGWPSRFHVVPPWMVTVELRDGLRRYAIGAADVNGDILHIRYQSTTDQAHGTGPLDAGRARLVAAQMLGQYAYKLAAGGGIPAGVLNHPEELSAEQAQLLQAQWVAARMSTIGEPAVLSGGLTWAATQLNAKDMALVELSQFNESRIAVLLGVPPFLLGLPSGGDSMTYANTVSLFDYHWRAGLRPKAQAVMAALSEWALPRGTRVELNRDEYIRPEPYQRAQTAQILFNIVDPTTGERAMTVDEIRAAERLDNTTPADVAAGVLR
jgi:HK97 family phage portal protein